MWWRRALCALLVTGVAGVTGCGGYRMAGDTTAIGIDRVTVPAFANETLEPFLSETVTRILHERLLLAGVRLETGGPVLTGRITAISDQVHAFDVAGTARHRRLVIRARTTLQQDGSPLWEALPVTGSAEYPVTTDPNLNRDYKDRAIEEAAFGLAESILLQLAAHGVPQGEAVPPADMPETVPEPAPEETGP